MIEFDESLAQAITNFDQFVLFFGSIAFQIVLLIMIYRRRIRWRYTVLPGSYAFHLMLFYIVDFYILPGGRELSWFMTSWSTVLRVHEFAIIIILFFTLYRHCKLWTYK